MSGASESGLGRCLKVGASFVYLPQEVLEGGCECVALVTEPRSVAVRLSLVTSPLTVDEIHTMDSQHKLFVIRSDS
ncbi:hypothetical protein AXK56_15785 [Tsukamurella pulmonis]|nr:hypothetical protein AXK56_15785 [Tsukamurella pulmonis]